MPRRSRHGDHRGPAPPAELGGGEEGQRRERAKVFERTKMCKFHILGCCSRGSACHFAHNKEELTSQPDLARTKLCKTLISTGQCTDPECRYAHSKEEMRLVLGFNCGNAHALQAAPVTDSRPAPPAPGQAGAAPAGGASGPGGGASGPAGQESSSLQQPGTALQQAAMQQLAEAAQAHAAEAMRLQAMAACLQAQGAGLPAQFAGVPFVAAAQGCGGFPGIAVPTAPPQPLAAGAHTGATGPAPGRSQRGRGDRGRGKGGRGGGGQQQAPGKVDANAGHFPRAGNGNMFRAQVPSAAEPMPSPAGPYPLMGGGLLSQSLPDGGGAPGCYFGQMPHGTEPDSGMVGGLPSEENFTPREPVQINPLSMRSLSNCSLVDLAAKAEAEGQGATPPGQQLQTGQGTSALGWTVKNTFLDFEGTSPAPGRLRPICSAAGRLNALAEGSTPNSPDFGPHEDPYMESARGLVRQVQQLSPAPEDFTTPALAQQPSLLAEKRAQDTPLAIGQAPPRAAAATASPQWPAGQLAGHAAGGCGGGAPRTGGGFASTVTGGGTEDAQNGAVTEAGDHQQEQSESSSSPTGAVAGEMGPCGGSSTVPGAAAPSPGLGAPLLVEGITVKNTFLDFAPREPAAALRAVQTAAGRLDLLGHEDDDED